MKTVHVDDACTDIVGSLLLNWIFLINWIVSIEWKNGSNTYCSQFAAHHTSKVLTFTHWLAALLASNGTITNTQKLYKTVNIYLFIFFLFHCALLLNHFIEMHASCVLIDDFIRTVFHLFQIDSCASITTIKPRKLDSFKSFVEIFSSLFIILQMTQRNRFDIFDWCPLWAERK